MKHNFKRILAAIMAVAMLFSLSVNAFAAATPNATIDYGRKGSISLYKYDMTTAAKDGKWNTESYVSTGLTDEAVEAALNPYAVQGVEFSYLRVADIAMFSGLVEGESVTKVLYGVKGTEQDMAFLSALGLSANDCYAPATKTADGATWYGDEGNPNEVTLEWRRTNTAYYDTLRDCCHLYTYGIQLHKRFSDNAGDYAQVNFTFQNTTDGYWLKAELAEDGLYYVTDHVATEAEATSFVPNSDSGVLTVWGLEDDAYTVTETHTAQGYTLLRDSIEIVISTRESDTICEVCGAAFLTASATVNGKAVTMLANNGSVNAQVPLTVVNTKGPDLPVTGDDGVWRYGVFGVLLMVAAGTAIVFVLKDKKSNKGKQ